jgi:predicted DNA-binding transcriptional regulator AlpA
MNKKTNKQKSVRARTVLLGERSRQREMTSKVFSVVDQIDANPNDEAILATVSTLVDVIEDRDRVAEETLIGISQVVRISGVSSSEVDRQVRSGSFPAPLSATEGKHRRWLHSDIIHWIEKHLS